MDSVCELGAMTGKLRLLDIFEGKRQLKVALAVSIFSFLLLELILILAALNQTGKQSRILITDSQGKVVADRAGSTLTAYERLEFEKTFGPLKDYQVHLQSETVPFPFRAWASAAVGVPIGLVLLIAFVIRAYLTLVYGEEDSGGGDSRLSPSPKGRWGSLFDFSRRVTVFHVGFLVAAAVILLWVVPNFLGDLAKIGAVAIEKYKGFFVACAVFLASLITWIVYLRYRLSKQLLDNQLDLEKYRVEKQLLLQNQPPSPLLPEPVQKNATLEESHP